MLTFFSVVLLMILAGTFVVAAHSIDTEREKLNRRRNPRRGKIGRVRRKSRCVLCQIGACSK